VISNFIKHKLWNYDSCKVISISNASETELREDQQKQIEKKIRLKFMNVRQNSRRDNLKKFIFGVV
jgi:hypothetical protein